MKKLFVLAVMLGMLFGLVGCNQGENGGTQGGNPTNEPTQPQSSEDLVVEGFSAVGKKVYLTSIGQSDLETVKNILISSGKTDATIEAVLEAEAVEEGSVVLVVTGSSTKGLGSAGTDIGKENTRAANFAKAAKEGKLELVVLHVGGTARRGAQADPIINTVVPEADLVMVVSEGNQDGKFTQLTSADAKLYLYSRASTMVASMKAIFGL